MNSSLLFSCSGYQIADRSAQDLSEVPRHTHPNPPCSEKENKQKNISLFFQFNTFTRISVETYGKTTHTAVVWWNTMPRAVLLNTHQDFNNIPTFFRPCNSRCLKRSVVSSNDFPLLPNVVRSLVVLRALVSGSPAASSVVTAAVATAVLL